MDRGFSLALESACQNAILPRSMTDSSQAAQ
jgi:hypothetical protein